MKNYSHIFFDLDRTLWDFDANSNEAMKDLFKEYNLKDFINAEFEPFYKTFLKYNDELWNDFRAGRVFKSTIKTKRFHLSLKDFGIESNSLTKKLSDNFSKLISLKTKLFPDAIEVLEYLKDNYSLAIITNGFKDIQGLKIKNSNLSPYFNKVIISESIGSHKPDSKIFKKALSITNAKKETSIMIGDDLEIDILGAKNSGIDQVYFNPSKKIHSETVTFEIHSLKELLKIL